MDCCWRRVLATRGKCWLLVNASGMVLLCSSVGRILKTFLDADHSDHLALCPRLAVNVDVDQLRVEFVDHFLLGCAKREGVAHHAADISEVMVTLVSRVTLHLKGDIQELLFGLRCISHNWKYCSRLPELSKL